MPRKAFGVDAVLTRDEATALLRDLSELWHLTYGKNPDTLEDDLKLCARFFDPLARGQTLRERLSQLPDTPSGIVRNLQPLGLPLVVDAGEGVLLVGVEARLLIGLIEREYGTDDHVVLSAANVAAAEHEALELYRDWSTARLTQVIDLRSGRGKEVMQSIAVGLAIALLVNRSDAPDRAMSQWDHTSAQGRQVDRAIYAGAERFADAISNSRRGRSQAEQRLKGGYALTEARRRLAHRITVSRMASGEVSIFVPPKHRADVVDILGRDLARRSSLTDAVLGAAFDELVIAFRASAENLAHRSLVFERATDTDELRQELISAFSRARSET